jgi:hypothetical protein
MAFEDLFDITAFKLNATVIPKEEFLNFDPNLDLDTWVAPKEFWKRLNGHYHTYKGHTIPTPCTLEWCIHTANFYSDKPKFHTKALKDFMLISGTTLQTWAKEANCDVNYLIAAIITSKYSDTPVGKFAAKEITLN